MRTAGGGAGGYAAGYLILKKGDVLYVTCGGIGTASGYYSGGYSNVGALPTGNGYNGGGATYGSTQSGGSGGGGGATHIATVSGTLTQLGSGNLSKILVIAGGGGGGTASVNVNSKNQIKSENCSGGGAGGAGLSSGYFGYGAASNGGGRFGSSTAGARSGGSSYTGGVPSFVFAGTTYSPSASAGANGGAGKAAITYVSPLLSVTLPAYASYTEQDNYSISAPVTNAVSYKWQVSDENGDWLDLYDSADGLYTEHIPAGFEDVSFVEHLAEGTGSIAMSGTVTPEFDGTKIRAIVTDAFGETDFSESLLQITRVERSARNVVGMIGESADFYFTVHGAKSAALQVRAYGTDTWETYTPAAGVVNNPITTTVRDGEVTFHFGSLTEGDLKKYYRIVLANDGSGLTSEEILLTSCIYDLYYISDAVENLYYDGEEVNAVYFNTGTDYVLVYGFE